jgi:hypothetical protein
MSDEMKPADTIAKRTEAEVEPLDRAEYLQRRKEYAAQYQDAISNYDKLVPWGAGGALFLSITFLEKIAAHPLPSTRWLLLSAWGFLLVALATSLWSHYTSSRIYVWKMNLLDNRQRVNKSNNEDWTRERAGLRKRVRWWGRLTAFLNPVAGWALVIGVTLLAGFAFANAPFTGEPRP